MEVPDLCWGGGWVGGGYSAQPNSWRPDQRETEKTGEQQSGSCPRPRKLSVLFTLLPVLRSRLPQSLRSTGFPDVPGCPTLSPARLLLTCQASSGLHSL